ncbi:hypothetical protein C8R43DRAFT_1105853 [Mycena crocata]|nr:hypothetical protein C8R43DRAFT_1105853 [Mycena crocata]
MLLECTECQLPYYNWDDLLEHYEVTHPKIHRQNNRLPVLIVRRILNRHVKTYRCPHCYMPFPHPDLRDSHVEFTECDPDDHLDFQREDAPAPRRGSIHSIVAKFSNFRGRRGSTSSSESASSSRRGSTSSLESEGPTISSNPRGNPFALLEYSVFSLSFLFCAEVVFKAPELDPNHAINMACFNKSFLLDLNVLPPGVSCADGVVLQPTDGCRHYGFTNRF